MKLHYLFLLLLFLSKSHCWSQNSSEVYNPLKVHKKYATIKISLYDKIISKREFEDMMRSDYSSYSYFRKGKSRDILSNTMSLTGVLFTLGGISAVLTDDEDYIYPLAIGIGLFLTSLPILNSAKKNYSLATEKYAEFNSNKMSYLGKNEVYFSITNKSVGIKVWL